MAKSILVHILASPHYKKKIFRNESPIKSKCKRRQELISIFKIFYFSRTTDDYENGCWKCFLEIINAFFGPKLKSIDMVEL